MQTFNPTQFKLDYPEFANISDSRLTNLFNYNAKSFYQWVFDKFIDENQQYYWSCVVLAHILILLYGFDGSGNSNLLGRINSVSESDVSTSSEFNTIVTKTSAWWNQTKYGAMCWALIQQQGFNIWIDYGY